MRGGKERYTRSTCAHSDGPQDDTVIQHESDELYCSFLFNGCRTFRAVALSTATG